MSGASALEDLGHWAIWWDLNKAPYLNLREQIWTGGPLSGSGGDLFLGIGQVDQVERSLRPTRDMIQRDIVPLLEAALATETSNDIVTGALIALARIGDRRDEHGETSSSPQAPPSTHL